jgi:hypothetical protein
MHAIAPVRLEQDRARRKPVLHHDTGIEAEIGADIDEHVGLERGAARGEIPQLAIFADLRRNLEAADIDRAHQKVGPEIAADEITPAMAKLVVRLVEAAPPFVAPPKCQTHHAPTVIRCLAADRRKNTIRLSS